MPDSPIDSIATGAGVATNAIQTGAHYATAQADVNLRQQALQQEYDNHQEMKRQFNVETGKTMVGMLVDAATEAPGPVKNAKMKAIQNWSEQSGMPIDPTWVAATNDEVWAPKIKALGQALNMSDQQAQHLQDFYAGTVPILGKTGTSDLLDKAISGITMANAAGIRASGMAGPRNDQNTINAPDKVTNDPVLKVYRNNMPQIAGDLGQLYGKNPISIRQGREIQMKFANYVTGANNAGASDFKAKELSLDSFATKWGDIMQNVSGDPDQPLPPKAIEFLKSFGNRIFNTMEIGAQQTASEKGDPLANNIQNQNAAQAVRDSQEPYTSGRSAYALRKQYGLPLGPISSQYAKKIGANNQPAPKATTAPQTGKKLSDIAPTDRAGFVDLLQRNAKAGRSRAMVENKLGYKLDDQLANQVGLK